MRLSERIESGEPFEAFFDVDDTVVRVSSDGRETTGEVVSTGVPFPPLKAAVEGNEISPEEAASRASSADEARA